MQALTMERLVALGACADGKAWFEGQRARDPVKVLRKLLKEAKGDVEDGRLGWANWLVVRLLDRKGRIVENGVGLLEKQA